MLKSKTAKRLLSLLVVTLMVMGSTAFAFADTGNTVLTVMFQNQAGTVLSSKDYSASDLAALSSDTKIKFSSIDKMPAARGTVATGMPLSTLLSDASSVYTFDQGDTITMTDTDGKKPFHVNFSYDALYNTPRYYFPNLNETWVPAEMGLDENGNEIVVVPGYLGLNPTINGVPVQPFLATNYYQQRYLKDIKMDTATLTPAAPVTFCYGQTEAEVNALTPTNNNFISSINTITITEAN